MPRVFISYRRNDSDYTAGRIRDRLVHHLGPESVFFDVDNIPLGTDFRKVIRQELSKTEALLAIIGQNWLTAADDSGERRLDSETDFVRIEIEAALEMGIPVIPLLVGSVRLPKPHQLPEKIADLSFRHALNIRPDPDFNSDIGYLVRSLTIAESEKRKDPNPEPVPEQETEPLPLVVQSKPDPRHTQSQQDSAELSLIETNADPLQDEFLTPFPGIELGITSEDKVREFAAFNKIPEYVFDFRESVLSKYSISGWGSAPKNLYINISTLTIHKVFTRLSILGYQPIITAPRPVRNWYEFWDKTHALSIKGRKNLTEGIAVEISFNFMAPNLDDLYEKCTANWIFAIIK